MAKDNTTLQKKIALRRALRPLLSEPMVILETHGGVGSVYHRVYAEVQTGIVFETDDRKAEYLARQRPAWSVYQADVTPALAANVGAHLCINWLDLDPYGDPWPTLDAFFESDRPRADTLILAVNDGLRQKLQMTGGWTSHSLEGVVRKYGNSALYHNYLDVCQELVASKAAQQGYSLRRWTGYYAGAAQHMTHYGAMLSRTNSVAPSPAEPLPVPPLSEVRSDEIAAPASGSDNPSADTAADPSSHNASRPRRRTARQS